jgi:formimidoylglutamate deiminase
MSVLTLPGFVDAHCHGFQRAMRGRAGGGDFWAWREEMIALAESLSVAEIHREYLEVYRELRANGYTAVGEFHYLGSEEAKAAAEAAAEAGIAFVCLYACYLRGGSPRFRQESVAGYLRELEALRGTGMRVGVAPHSVRACPADALRELGRYADEHELPLHVHADEQPREIDECLAEHGLRPIEVLAREGCLGPHSTVVHATHADGGELDLLRDSSSRICVCPTTEANLGDGFLPVARVCHRDIELCIGSDSNVRIDPLEELRELEGIARRQTGKRGVISVDALIRSGTEAGASALGLDTWPEAIVDLDHPQLRGVDEAAVYEALVFSCTGDVLRKTSDQ